MRHFKEYYNVLKEELVVSKFLIDSLLGCYGQNLDLGDPQGVMDLSYGLLFIIGLLHNN